MTLSRKFNYQKGLANCYLHRAHYYKSSSEYPTAITYYDSAIVVAGESTHPGLLRLKGWATEQKAAIYYSQENYYTALDYFFESLKYEDATKEQKKKRIYTFITEIYTLLNNLEKAGEYALRNIELVENDTDIIGKAGVYLSYINICLEKGDFGTATLYLDKMSPFIPHAKQGQLNFGYYLKRGKLSYLRHEYEQAYSYFKEANIYAVSGGHSNSKSISLYYLARTALELGYTEDAKKYTMENLALTDQMSAKSARIDALANMSAYYKRAGDKDKAYEMILQAMELKDTLTRETNVKQVNVLGAIYEYGKQQKEIVTLQNEKDKQEAAVKQKSFLNYVFIASIGVLLLLGYLGYNNFRKGKQLYSQRQALQDQKIIELEKNKQLLTVDAMLKGQEEERSRIAKDLHDGVGSLLSGTKMSFLHIKENLELSGEGRMMFEKSLCMLDNTIGELRKVAQNLMPEALVKFGLHEALRDFCDSIQSSTGLKVLYQQFGEKRKLDNTAEIFTYRIIQELVNNAVKHAGASQVIVQLAIGQHKTGITVEDDGRGFDKDKLNKAKGAGLANVNYRVQYFNGMYDIVTSPGNGTSVNIELTA
jgi:signal transduction histidine kinase